MNVEQTADLNWNAFLNNSDTGTSEGTSIYYSNGSTSGSTVNRDYLPVNTTYKLTYDGKGHQITNVESGSGTESYAGLFGAFDQPGSSVSNLRLVDFSLKSSDSGFAGRLPA